MFMPLLICGKISAMEQEKDYLQILKNARKNRVCIKATNLSGLRFPNF